eukprot:CAMPEP_0182447504 /NCGR_PEP_ID=MMETSP1172-20130603/16833_1 /TAXON_ID=708627 /ORGANISM="Timspurckia oligopyrenoides, Strain CCMP3278" /LENGTH=483 /DNA_ID=CAMNT_0024643965 /DNA_START=148 /DNA_END=1596 /DNA_ORIENTATION=-
MDSIADEKEDNPHQDIQTSLQNLTLTGQSEEDEQRRIESRRTHTEEETEHQSVTPPASIVSVGEIESQESWSTTSQNTTTLREFTHSSASTKLFVGGLSWDTTEQSMKTYFEQFGNVISCVVMHERLTNQPRGFGFVQFATNQIADQVVRQKHVIDGRQVETKFALPKTVPASSVSSRFSSPKQFRTAQDSSSISASGTPHSSGQRGVFQSPNKNAFVITNSPGTMSNDTQTQPHSEAIGAESELSMEGERSVSVPQVPLNRKLFVGGLPLDCTEMDLREYFKTYGSVTHAQIMIDPQTTRSRGFAFISFRDAEEASEVLRVSEMKPYHVIRGKKVDVKRAEPKGSSSSSSHRASTASPTSSNVHIPSTTDTTSPIPPSMIPRTNVPYQLGGNYGFVPYQFMDPQHMYHNVHPGNEPAPPLYYGVVAAPWTPALVPMPAPFIYGYPHQAAQMYQQHQLIQSNVQMHPQPNGDETEQYHDEIED